MYVCVHTQSLSPVQLFAIPWTSREFNVHLFIFISDLLDGICVSSSLLVEKKLFLAFYCTVWLSLGPFGL